MLSFFERCVSFLKLTLIRQYFLKISIFLGSNFNSLIICCLSSEDMYLFLWAVISTSSLLLFLLLDFFETLVILSAILLPIKSPVASAVFWIALFEAVFIVFVVDFLALSRPFWLYLLVKLLPNKCFI